MERMQQKWRVRFGGVDGAYTYAALKVIRTHAGCSAEEAKAIWRDGGLLTGKESYARRLAAELKAVGADAVCLPVMW